MPPIPTGCLVRLNTATSTPALVAAHGWGGHLFHPSQLGTGFSETFSFYGLQPRERSGGPRHSSFVAMCSDYAAEIAAALPGTPVVLYGYSLGGMIAYETGYQLHKRGHPVAEVIAVDAYPGNLPMPVHFVSIAPSVTKRTLQHLAWALKNPAGLVAYLKQRHRSLRNIVARGGRKQTTAPDPETPGLDPSPADDPGADYHQTLADRYNPIPSPLDITLVRCRRSTGFLYPRWRYLCRAKLRVIPVDFTHHNLISPPGIEVLAGILRRRFDALSSRPAAPTDARPTEHA